MPWCWFLGRHVARQINKFTETEPGLRRSRGHVWWYAGGAGGDDAADGYKVHTRGVDGIGRGKADKGRARGLVKGPSAGAWSRRRQHDVSCWPRRWVPPAALRRVAWILEVLVWRCHARLPNVIGSFLNFLMTVRMLVAGSLLVTGRSSGKWNQTVCAVNFLETGGVGFSAPCEKVGYSTLSNDLASPAFHRLHSAISDFRPPSVTESGEAVHRRLLASSAVCVAL